MSMRARKPSSCALSDATQARSSRAEPIASRSSSLMASKLRRSQAESTRAATSNTGVLIAWHPSTLTPRAPEAGAAAVGGADDRAAAILGEAGLTFAVVDSEAMLEAALGAIHLRVVVER